MASSTGDEEASTESMSRISVRQALRQEPAFASWSMAAGGHGPVGSRPAARLDGALAQTGEWDQYKSLMRRLYMDENKTLTEVREHMRIHYSFTASWVYPQTKCDAILTDLLIQSCSTKMFKTRFIGWGWRKNIKLTAGLDPKEVQNAPYEDSVRPGTQIRLANGQLVDTSRLQKHLRRKRVYTTIPLTAVVRPPDSHHITEAVFAYSRTYALGRHEREITSLTEALSILTLDQPSTSRWFGFTNEINDAMKQQDVSQALIRLRKAPDEVAIMFKSEPSTTVCNIFMLIVQLNRYAEATGADAQQFRVLLKALLKYAASLGFSGALGLPGSHPLPHLMKSLALVPHSELNEVSIRAWKVTCQAWAEMAFSSSFSTVGSKSLARWLRVGDKGEMDGMWFFQLIGGIIDEQMEVFEELYGKRDFRYLDSLQGKADLLSYVDMAKGVDCYQDPTVMAIYQQMLAHGVQGPRRTAALKFIAKSTWGTLENGRSEVE